MADELERGIWAKWIPAAQPRKKVSYINESPREYGDEDVYASVGSAIEERLDKLGHPQDGERGDPLVSICFDGGQEADRLARRATRSGFPLLEELPRRNRTQPGGDAPRRLRVLPVRPPFCRRAAPV